MIRKANSTDIDKVMEIVRETINEMHSYGNYQWDENYPKKDDFLQDITKEHLYVAEKQGLVVGFICINSIEPAEYREVAWSRKTPALVLHRMSISSAKRNGGIGLALLHFAEQLAQEKGIDYLKTDTYSINTKANSNFKKFSYTFVGEMSFLSKEKPFYCY